MQTLVVKKTHLIFFPDRVIPRPSDRFISREPNAFHFNQDITLPSFLKDQGTPHPLDVGLNTKACLMVTGSFRKADNLLVIPQGARRGQAASSCTISSWLIKTINKSICSPFLATPPSHPSHFLHCYSPITSFWNGGRHPTHIPPLIIVRLGFLSSVEPHLSRRCDDAIYAPSAISLTKPGC